MKNCAQLVQQHNLVPMALRKVQGTEVLWRSRADDDVGALDDAQFLDAFSRVVPNGFFADATRFHDDLETGFAERYGGVGIGCNGGGARVANLRGVQIKGVGANALAGRDAPRSHSYGGLDLESAAKEIVYSTLLNRISPVGAQKIHGLILLDRESAEHEAGRACSVLLVREPGVRPAHFLPCTDFRPKPEFKSVLRSDFSRIRNIYTSIPREGGLSEFYVFVQDFLDRAADQLSYFRMARISHNALVPSNFLVDGRVMDTSLCSFVVAGHNYGQVTSYFEEPNVPLQVVGEMFHQVRKFTQSKVSVQHFADLYLERFRQFSCLNTGFLFGIGRALAAKFSTSVEWRKVSARLQSIVVLGRGEKSHKLPTVDLPDVASDMLAASLYSLVSGIPIGKGGKFITGLADDLRALVDRLFHAYEEHFGSRATFVNVFAVQTLKRAFLSSYFFITYIGKAVDDAGRHGDVGTVLEIVRASERLSEWIFEDITDCKCTLFRNDALQVYFDGATASFGVRQAGGGEERVMDAATFVRYVAAERARFGVHGYDFAPFLMELGAFFGLSPAASFRGTKNVFS
jgi:hypothetical protein